MGDWGEAAVLHACGSTHLGWLQPAQSSSLKRVKETRGILITENQSITDFIWVQELGRRNGVCWIPSLAFFFNLFVCFLCLFRLCSFLLQRWNWMNYSWEPFYVSMRPWDKLPTRLVLLPPKRSERVSDKKKKKRGQIYPSVTRHLAKGQWRGRHQITSSHYWRLYHSADRINVQPSRDTKSCDISREWKFTGDIHERSSGVFFFAGQTLIS